MLHLVIVEEKSNFDVATLFEFNSLIAATADVFAVVVRLDRVPIWSNWNRSRTAEAVPLLVPAFMGNNPIQ